jgi:hypothetical protein
MRFREIYNQLPESIDINGNTRPTRNSEGMPIAGSKKGLLAFYAWFGDSKVVDNERRPLVVYHGTVSEFDAFDDKKTGLNDRGLWGRGHYFSTGVDGPNSYALRQGDGARIIPAYVLISNPFIVTTGTDFITRLPNGTNQRDLLGPDLDGSKIKDQALKGGHDGVIQIKRSGLIGDLVAFSPNQIKSINNRGTFDPVDARILY